MGGDPLPYRPATLLPDFTGAYFDQQRYLILEFLGSGSYAKVYKCLDTRRPIPVFFAVKCMSLSPTGTIQFAYQQEELKLHERVSYHPNILSILRVVYEHNFVYVVLQLCTGGDLGSLLFANSRPLTDYEIRRLFLQILDSTMECHRQGVYHRDIKPENILLSADRTEALLSDFGLATTSPTSSEFTCGSSRYWSPENLNENSAFSHYPTSANDVWSLGILLVNMVSGKDPWASPSEKDPHFSAFLKDPEYLSKLGISIPLQRILSRVFCLVPNLRISLEQFWVEIVHLETFRARVQPSPWPTSSEVSWQPILMQSPSSQEYSSYFSDCSGTTSRHSSHESLEVGTPPDALQLAQKWIQDDHLLKSMAVFIPTPRR